MDSPMQIDLPLRQWNNISFPVPTRVMLARECNKKEIRDPSLCPGIWEAISELLPINKGSEWSEYCKLIPWTRDPLKKLIEMLQDWRPTIAPFVMKDFKNIKTTKNIEAIYEKWDLSFSNDKVVRFVQRVRGVCKLEEGFVPPPGCLHEATKLAFFTACRQEYLPDFRKVLVMLFALPQQYDIGQQSCMAFYVENEQSHDVNMEALFKKRGNLLETRVVCLVGGNGVASSLTQEDLVAAWFCFAERDTGNEEMIELAKHTNKTQVQKILISKGFNDMSFEPIWSTLTPSDSD